MMVWAELPQGWSEWGAAFAAASSALAGLRWFYHKVSEQQYALQKELHALRQELKVDLGETNRRLDKTIADTAHQNAELNKRLDKTIADTAHQNAELNKRLDHLYTVLIDELRKKNAT